MTKRLLLSCLALVALGAVIAEGPAVPEPSVEEIYFERYGVPLPPVLPDDGVFFQVEEPSIIYVQALYASAENGLGWYSEGVEYVLMDPLAVGMEAEFSAGDAPFGFWMITRYGAVYKCYSDPDLNGGVDRLHVYDTPVTEEYFLAWEDCASADGDFNDVVLIGSHFAPTTYAERATWGILKALYR